MKLHRTTVPDLCCGPRPKCRDDVRLLYNRYVRTFISLQSRYFEADELEQEQNWVLWLKREKMSTALTMKIVPLGFFLPPSRLALSRAVVEIETGLRQGAVYLHGADDVERAYAVIWAYMVWIGAEDVYASYMKLAHNGARIRYLWWLPFVAHSLRKGMVR